MIKPKMEMALAPPVKPATDKWEGVKQVFLGLHQDKTAKADAALAEKILGALRADHLLGKRDVAHIRITVNSGVVTLTGHVVRAVNKARAEAAAREASGVTAVVNHLVADNELMIEVAQALGHDQQTEREQIQVNVQHGVVYLGGAVNRAAIRTAAAQVAAGVAQVRGIINVIQTPGIEMDKDEERLVQPQIESEIYANDGAVGRVQQVVINPQNRRVTAVVVHTQIAVAQVGNWTQLPTDRSLPAHCMLIPINNIRCAPSGALFLNINSEAAAHFANVTPHDFGPPPLGWQPPYPYLLADVLVPRRQSREESR